MNLVLLIIFFLIIYISFKFNYYIESFGDYNIPDLKKSNDIIIKLIQNNKPFMITRLGIGSETQSTYKYSKNEKINKKNINVLSNNAGIYDTNNDIKILEKYCGHYLDSIKNSSYMATWSINSGIDQEQKYFIEKFNLKSVTTRVLEPFYIIDQNIKPWSNYLKNKKILIIHPFINSFKIQMKNKFKFFDKNNDFIFHPEQEFIFYKSFNTAAGNHIHKNWLETFKIMCNDIKNINFDVALLGCGGYGLPLCNYIFKDLKKSSIYIGGGLQLLFGIYGKRWETNKDVQKILQKNNTISRMIRPIPEDSLKNSNKIEGACYW